eukprot:EG_transcript_11229
MPRYYAAEVAGEPPAPVARGPAPHIHAMLALLLVALTAAVAVSGLPNQLAAFAVGRMSFTPHMANRAFRATWTPERPVTMRWPTSGASSPLRADTSLFANKLPSAAGLIPREQYCATFGKTLVIGGGRGLGLALVQLLKGAGCEVYTTVRGPSDKLTKLGLAGIIPDIDMMDYDAPKKLAAGLGSLKLDTLIHVAGYFTTEGPLTNLNRQEEVKMFEICAIAPVFITAELLKNGNIGQGTRVGFITSEGGSIGLRTEKEGGANYGHHMSKAASNMAGRLMAWDLKPHGVGLVMIHPGFLRTEMTADKYAHLYDELDAVTADEAAPFILQPIADLTLDNTGRFVAALGSQGLGLGVWALPMKLEYPAAIPPGGELPF